LAAAPRLLLIASEFPPGPGGIGVHAYQMAVHLQRFGWRLEVAASQPYGRAKERNCFNGQLPFPMTPLSASSTGQRFQQILRKIKMFRPDVMVASGGRPLWATAIFSKLFHIPWLAVGHGTEFLSASPLFRFLTQAAIGLADQAVAVSQYTARLMRTQRSADIIIIPNGADGEHFRPDWPAQSLRQQLGLAGKQVLLTVGNVSERKAQDVVIQALPRVLARCPDVVYLIAGLPTRQKALTRLAQDLGVSEQVCFTGVVSTEILPIYYNLCDLFVLVSRKTRAGDVEGYGIVVVEAALCGKTAVVSDHGGLPEAVHHGETGLIVPAESPEETAEAIINLLTDQAQRQALARRALEQATGATWASRMAAYDAILRGMIA
jgi:phosphatidylinositol alpha-1,6-mannosyltransferase